MSPPERCSTFTTSCCASADEGGVGMRWRQLEAPGLEAPPGAISGVRTGKVPDALDLEYSTRGLLVTVAETGQACLGMWTHGLLVHSLLEQGSSVVVRATAARFRARLGDCLRLSQ
jgi:hypothetical protein